MEYRAGLSRIGIETEDQELGREGAEIDPSADQRLRFRRISRGRAGFFVAFGVADLRREQEFDVLRYLVDERLQRNHARLTDRRRTRPETRRPRWP